MRALDARAGLNQGYDAPLIKTLRDAIAEYKATYNIAPELCYGSPKFNYALERWAMMNDKLPSSVIERLKGATVLGLEIFNMTKTTSLVECYIGVKREGVFYYSHIIFEPNQAGIATPVVRDKQIDMGEIARQDLFNG